MLVTARACQGAFAAILVPSALSLLTTTFTEPAERGKAFGVYGATSAAGAAVGLLLGGALTEYLSWRWTLYINLAFASLAFIGGTVLLGRHPSRATPKLDIPGCCWCPVPCSAWSTDSPTPLRTTGTRRPRGASLSPG
jgi:MFS family permease